MCFLKASLKYQSQSCWYRDTIYMIHIDISSVLSQLAAFFLIKLFACCCFYSVSFEVVINLSVFLGLAVIRYGLFRLHDFSLIFPRIPRRRQNCWIAHDFKKLASRFGLVWQSYALRFFSPGMSKTQRRKVWHARILGELQWCIECWHQVGIEEFRHQLHKRRVML